MSLARSALLALVLALIALPVAATADEGHGLDDLVPAEEVLYISAGCVGTPTCTSTRWLGRDPGTATSNWLTATTPVDEVYAISGSAPNWRDYASDETLNPDGYILNAEKPMAVTVTVQGNVLTARNTVHARLTLVTDGGYDMLPAQSDMIDLIAGAGEESVTLNFAIPAALHGETLTSLTAEVAVHGINAQGGYINQAGKSTVVIPHLVEA